MSAENFVAAFKALPPSEAHAKLLNAWHDIAAISRWRAESAAVLAGESVAALKHLLGDRFDDWASEHFTGERADLDAYLAAAASGVTAKLPSEGTAEPSDFIPDQESEP